jgi:hypothetical protein
VSGQPDQRNRRSNRVIFVPSARAHRPRKAHTMRDRDRKREADGERRARIKAGTWDFPNGGAAEFAKAGAAIHTSPKRLSRSPKPPNPSQKLEVFTSAPAPRPIASAPARSIASSPLRHVITPMSTDVVSPAPARVPSTSSGAPPSMVAIGGRPGRGLLAQGYGYPAPPDIAAVSTFTKWRESTETMLATLAAKADMQDRRIAALEGLQADRRAYALEVAGAIVGLFNSLIQGRANAARVASPKASTRPGKR